ncbi:MAG TPA: hypothetical protein VMF08_08905 [Candidatus Sulfotelmatobacter sp.]|nr:hypothetical protein [Candidatus Sulfotelmatobacter sp.]
MDNLKIKNLKIGIADFLRGWGGPVPFSQISKQLSIPPNTAHLVIADMIGEGTIRANSQDTTYLRLTGEMVTYSLS